LKTDVLYSANFLKIHITFRGNGKIFLQILLQNLYNVKVGNIGYWYCDENLQMQFCDWLLDATVQLTAVSNG
jgi:hypothetical protein